MRVRLAGQQLSGRVARGFRLVGTLTRTRGLCFGSYLKFAQV